MSRRSTDAIAPDAPLSPAAPPAPRHLGAGLRLPRRAPDTLTWWAAQYFALAVTTHATSRQVQQRDLRRFIAFMRVEAHTEQRCDWTPQRSQAFQASLQRLTVHGQRAWSDRTIRRILAHVKTFAKWLHHVRPFPHGPPMAMLPPPPPGPPLAIDRALTASERRHLLEAADRLVACGGRSTDRRRHRGRERPRRQGYRALRNRAIIYTLVETGMRRAAVTTLNVADVDFAQGLVTATERGGVAHRYHISRAGLQAIQAYLAQERPQDATKWRSPALFLSPATTPHGNGRLSPGVINTVWNAVARLAGVQGKTPHAARHAMGQHIMEKTGNVAAVQRQLGHRHAAYAVQYARVTAAAIAEVINDRG
jgi:integrase